MAVCSGLAFAGVVEATPWEYLRQRLEKRRQEGRTTSFEEKEINRRLDPRIYWPEVRSIIVVGIPYLVPPPTPEIGTDEPRGKVARCAQGFDYHLLLKQYARRLTALLQKELSAPLNFRLLVDNSPLVERELAVRAGLGFTGENCNFIVPSRGSYFALGTILIDRKIGSPAITIKNSCLDCGRCREACPTGALIAPHTIDPNRCLSYISQLPGVIPEKYRPLFGNRLYGCDRCQEVCPNNQGPFETAPRGGLFPFFPAEPRLIPLLSITRKEFMSTIALTAAGWRGKTTLQRNAVVALGNSKDEEAVPSLARLLQRDARPVIRLHAAASLGIIGGPKARFYLEKCRQKDPAPAVRNEAHRALETTD